MKRFLRGLIVVSEFELRAFFNNRAQLYGIILDPIVYLLLLVAGLQGVIVSTTLHGKNIRYLQFMVPGLLALQTLRAFSRAIYRATVERRWGLLALKLQSGVPRTAYLMGLFLMPTLLFLIQATIILICAWIADVRWPVFSMLTALSVGCVCVWFWSAAGLLLTFGIRNYHQRDMLVSLLYLPLALSAPIFFPLTSAPVYLQRISSTNPLTYHVIALRDLLISNHIQSALAVTVGLTLVSLIACTFLLRRLEPIASER